MAYPIDGKHVVKEELIAKAESYIELLKLKVGIMDIVIPILKSFEGKTVSKRIQSAIQDKLPRYSVYYAAGVVEYELKIWGNGIAYDNMITIRLCRLGSDKVLRESSWYEYKNWYDYQGHIDKLNEFIANINHYVFQWNTMVDYLNEKNEVFKDVPYPLSESFYMRNLIR